MGKKGDCVFQAPVGDALRLRWFIAAKLPSASPEYDRIGWVAVDQEQAELSSYLPMNKELIALRASTRRSR